MKQPTIGDVLERTSLIDSCRQSEIPGIGIAARTFGMAIPDCIGNVTLLKPAVIIKRTPALQEGTDALRFPRPTRACVFLICAFDGTSFLKVKQAAQLTNPVEVENQSATRNSINRESSRESLGQARRASSSVLRVMMISSSFRPSTYRIFSVKIKNKRRDEIKKQNKRKASCMETAVLFLTLGLLLWWCYGYSGGSSWGCGCGLSDL